MLTICVRHNCNIIHSIVKVVKLVLVLVQQDVYYHQHNAIKNAVISVKHVHQYLYALHVI
jgi:hypothetical protein